MDKVAMLRDLIDHYTGGNKAKFAKKLGITPQTVSTWLQRGSMDVFKIYATCEYISPTWLLSGEGAMLCQDTESAFDIRVEQLQMMIDFQRETIAQKEQRIEELCKELGRLSSLLDKP